MSERRPLYLRPWNILLVGVGGAAGTLARYLVSLAVPEALQLPWPTLTVNLLGAFLLGILLEGLARRGRDEGRRRMLRLLIGTGFMGGFTTYSTLAVETEQLLRAGRVWESIGYGLTTVTVGLLAALLGMWIAAVHHRWVVRRAGHDRPATDSSAEDSGRAS
ncbi:MAG: fluoride efflux transporter CrcB [Microbacteriaceae bacterium]